MNFLRVIVVTIFFFAQGCGEEDITLIHESTGEAQSKAKNVEVKKEKPTSKPQVIRKPSSELSPKQLQWKQILDRYYSTDVKDREDLKKIARQNLSYLRADSKEFLSHINEFKKFVHQNYNQNDPQTSIKTQALQNALNEYQNAANLKIAQLKSHWKWGGFIAGAAAGMLWSFRGTKISSPYSAYSFSAVRFGKNFLVLTPSLAGIGYVTGRVIAQFYDEYSQIHLFILDETTESQNSVDHILREQFNNYLNADLSSHESEHLARKLSERIVSQPEDASVLWKQLQKMYSDHFAESPRNQDLEFRIAILEEQMQIAIERHNSKVMRESIETEEFFALSGALIGGGTTAVGFKMLGGKTPRAFVLRSFVGLATGDTLGRLLFTLEEDQALSITSVLD